MSVGTNVVMPAKRAMGGMVGAISANLPSHEGDRRNAMFRFVRALKALPRYRRVPAAQVEQVFREWHRQSLPFIETTDYARNWEDFKRMWMQVKHPADHVSLERIVEQVDSTPLPSPSPGLKSLWRRRLLAVCHLLQIRSGQRAFYLDSRAIGKLLGVSHVSVARVLRQFVESGVLHLVERGRRHRASKYRYIGHYQQPAIEEAAA